MWSVGLSDGDYMKWEGYISATLHCRRQVDKGGSLNRRSARDNMSSGTLTELKVLRS